MEQVISNIIQLIVLQ